MLPVAAAFLGLFTNSSPRGNKLTQALFAFSALIGLFGVILFAVSLSGGNVAAVSVLGLGVVTPFAAPFLALIFLGFALTSVYSMAALEKYRDVYSLPWLNLASALFVIGMLGVVLAPSILIFLFAWELMSIAAYFLVIADGTPESLRAGFLYFVMTHVGFLALAAGFLLLSSGNPTLSWGALAQNAATLSMTQLSICFALLFIGFGSKAGLVPLHQWLPYAHPQAPSGSSALLSGVMLKVAVFGFLEALGVFPFIALPWALVIIGIGLLSAFFGVLHAVVENDAKRLLAWSSVENMGLIFCGIGLFFLATPGSSLAAFAPLFFLFVTIHILNHFLFKSGLFMAVGAVQSATHTRDLDSLGGLAQRWPVFSGAFLALALAAAALPPLGTFFGEWTLVQTLAFALGSPVLWQSLGAALLIAVVALVGGLAILAFVKLFSLIFLGRARTKHAEHAEPIPFLMTAPIALCALLSAGVSLVVFPLLASPGNFDFASLIRPVQALPGASIHPWFAFFGIAAALALAWLLVIFFSRNTSRVTDSWDCGQPITPRMQYTATGFAAPIRFFFRSFIGARREITAVPIVPSNPWIVQKKLEWRTDSLWEVWLYHPLGGGIMRIASLVRRLQNGVVQFYLLLVLLTLIATLFFTL